MCNTCHASRTSTSTNTGKRALKDVEHDMAQLSFSPAADPCTLKLGTTGTNCSLMEQLFLDEEVAFVKGVHFANGSK